MSRGVATESDVLSLFSEPVAKWFRERHGTATEPQIEAWPRIKRGENVLIHSPTGSGKTLAAFLSSLDTLYSDTALGKKSGIRTLYISPLKALGYDVERNLREPISGIEKIAKTQGVEVPEIRADVRTGDTPSSARARMVRNPPHILITTPESLYLILTSPRARETLQTVETVIVDEIHTLCTNKRGVHLSITLERLEQIAPNFQRIGLSATQRPLSEVARLLGGQSVRSSERNVEKLLIEPRPVSIVDCPGSKHIEISVHGMAEAVGSDPGSIWPKLIPTVLDDIEAHDTTLVFANSRRQAENTAERLNASWQARQNGLDEREVVGDGNYRSEAVDGPFMAHHGSLSDTLRREIEAQLKAGELPALVGTSSLELGIDIGSIDLVVQLQSPKTVTQGLQRVGRAGHSVGATSRGKIYATHPEDLIEAAVIVKGMQDRQVEHVVVPRNALDVLAQQIVAMVAVQDWRVDDLYRVIKGAYPYAELTFTNFLGAIRLVSGHYPRELFSSLRARIHWDETRDVLQQLPGTRMMAISNGGAIVDRGAFSVVLPDGKTRIGELDEEFVFESGEGDAFMLGSQVWRVAKIEDDRLIAEPAPGAAPRMPFWRGDFPWRPLDLSYKLARFRSKTAAMLRPFVGDEHAPPKVVEWLRTEYPIDDAGARQIIDYIRRQIRWSGAISSDKTVIVETYQDSIGDQRIVVHSPFGGRINGPWSVAIARELLKRKKVEPEVQVSDDGFMFRLPQSDDAALGDFVGDMTSAQAKELVLEGMIDSPLFGAVFRQNAYRALLLPSLGQFRRTPFWLQRLRAKDLLAIAKSFPDFPIVLETYRDALEDFMDMPGLERILCDIQNGDIELKYVVSDVPSPVARALDHDFVEFWMYQWDTPKSERSLQELNVDRSSLAQLFRNPEAAGLLRKEAIADVSSAAGRTTVGMKVRTETELAQLLTEIGDLSDEEAAERSEADFGGWLSSLQAQGRVEPIDFDVDGRVDTRWVATSLAAEYRRAISIPSDYASVRRVVARFLARSGPVSIAVLQSRYPIETSALHDALDELMADSQATKGFFTDEGVEEWLDLSMLARIQQRTLSILRSEVEPADPMNYQAALLARQTISQDTRNPAIEEVTTAIDQLQGVPIEAEQWTRDILPARSNRFRNVDLNELIESGEFAWVFCRDDHREAKKIALIRPGQARYVLAGATLELIFRGPEGLNEDALSVYDFIASEGVADSETILAAIGDATPSKLAVNLRDLAHRGLITCDSWTVAMAISRSSELRTSARGIQSRSPATSAPHIGSHRGSRRQFTHRLRETQGIFAAGVKWSTTSRFAFLGPRLDEAQLAIKRAGVLLRRHGIATKRAIELDKLEWEWRPIYSALSLMELRGKVRRGYFVTGLPGVQFAETEFIEAMRSLGDDRASVSMPRIIAANDPSFVFDRALASMTGEASAARLLGCSRNRNTKVAFENHRPTMVAHSNGSRIETADASEDAIGRAVTALIRSITASSTNRRVVISEWNGQNVFESPAAELLAKLGFRRDYPNMVADALSTAVYRR
jgi:ATP-dependent Lhr-like helicase